MRLTVRLARVVHALKMVGVPTDTARSIDVVLSWSRTQAGTTVVLKQADDGSWDEVGRTDSTEFTVTGLNPERAYNFAAAALDEDGFVAPADEWETLRVTPLADDATPAAPATPTGFAAAQDGANMNFRWDAAEDGVTAAYELRVGDSWEDAQLVVAGATGTTYSWPWSSSGAQTFQLKAVDRFDRASAAAASVVVTIAALDDHVTADASDQGALGWPGTKEHLVVDGGVLRLEPVPPFGALTVPFGSLAFPAFAKYWPSGSYETPPIDVGQVENQRVELALGGAQPIDADLPFAAVRRPALGARARSDGTLVPARTRGFSSRNSWRLAPVHPVDAKVEIDTSPTPDGAWDGWRPYAPGTYRYWRCRLRVTVTGDGLRFVRVPRLVVTRRKFNRKQEGHVVVNCSPVDVFFPVPFQNPPKVTATVLSYAGTPLVTNITATGFTIAGGAAVFSGDPATFAPTVHWQAMGT
jgi:hypothetical protein